MKTKKTGRPISTGNVFEANDGTWSFRYRNLPGLRPTRPTVRGFATRSEAFAAYLAKSEEIERLRDADDETKASASMKEWTLAEYVAYFLDHYEGAASTKTKLGHLLRKATDEFGRSKLRDLSAPRLRAWRNSIPEGHRFEAFQALRQVLAQATTERVVDRNATDGIKNAKPKRREIEAFASWAEVEDFLVEFPARDQPMIRFWAATGLRPGELFALEWKDVDLDSRRVFVRRQIVHGEIRPVKTDGSARTVPLNAKAREALDELLADGRDRDGVVFRTARGNPIDLHRWRARTWYAAVEAAGLSPRTPYVLRHTYATLALRLGQSTFEVARWMGTSIQMIDDHYGHLAADSIDAAIDRFDRYVAADAAGLRLVA